MTPLYAKCIAWIDALTPNGVIVYVRDQNAPAPPSPRVTVRIVTTSETSTYRGGINPDDDHQTVVRWHGFTLAMQIYGTTILEAQDIAQDILDQVHFSELRIEHLGRNATFNQVIAGPTSIDGAIGAQIEPRVTLDFQMSAVRDITYDVGPVEEVQFAGDVSGIAIGRNVTA